MKTKKILIALFIAFMIVCGLSLMTCKKLNCIGDGDCYVDITNRREKCGDRSCIAYKDVYFTGYKTRINCNWSLS